MLSLSPGDASLTLYTLLSAAKALAMALHYLGTLSTVSPHPTIASLGWHDLAFLFLDIHIFSDLFLLISASATQSLCHRTGYPFPKPCSETLNQIFSLSPRLSPPTCLLTLNLYLTPGGPLPQDFLSSVPLMILVTTYGPTEESFSNFPLAFSCFVLYILFGKFHPGLIPSVSFPAGKFLEKIRQPSEYS